MTVCKTVLKEPDRRLLEVVDVVGVNIDSSERAGKDSRDSDGHLRSDDIWQAQLDLHVV
jgi:hypothetical protein